jgi:hypothetical protein
MMVVSLLVTLAIGGAARAEVRSDAQQQYAAEIWKAVQSMPYHDWEVAGDECQFDFAPPHNAEARTYLNAKAAENPSDPPYGSLAVTEYLAEGEEQPLAVTIRYRFKEGYSPETRDFYWAHYLADGTVVKTLADNCPLSKRGFLAAVSDGRVWVFRTGSKELADYLRNGEPADHVIRPAGGPQGMTIKAPDFETIDEYAAAARGFETVIEDGRIWVFRAGSPELETFRTSGEPAEQVIRPAAGPLGMTVKAPDTETLEAYLQAVAG